MRSEEEIKSEIAECERRSNYPLLYNASNSIRLETLKWVLGD